MAYQRCAHTFHPPAKVKLSSHTNSTSASRFGNRVWFRPRILRDVSSVDWSTTILGQKSSLPVYIVRLFCPHVRTSIPQSHSGLEPDSPRRRWASLATPRASSH